MSILTNTLLGLGIILSFTFIQITSSPGYAIGYASTTNYRLDTTINKVIDKITAVQCASICSKNVSLKSYNFVKHDQSRLGRCEILELSRDEAPLATFISDPNSVYYERYKVIPDPCKPNPCFSNGVCTLTKSMDEPGFDCQCSFPMGGRLCQNLTCNGEVCSSFGDTVYFYNISRSTTWPDALAQCKARGMQLATPKSDEAFNSVNQFLVNMYKGNESLEHAYWIGLNRTTTSKPFIWIDGTPLESNSKKWADNRPTIGISTLCVEMANVEFKFRMDEEQCPGQGWVYGYICQQSYTYISY